MKSKPGTSSSSNVYLQKSNKVMRRSKNSTENAQKLITSSQKREKCKKHAVSTSPDEIIMKAKSINNNLK